MAQQYYVALAKASVTLQTNIRIALLAGNYRAYKNKVVLAQSVVRRHRVKKRIESMLAAQFDEVRMRLLRLWDANLVPKLYRSVFLLVYNSVTISNLFILLEEEKKLSPPNGEASGTPALSPLSSPLPTQERAFREEQKVIYELLRGYNPPEGGGINQLYITWGVDSTGKQRKLHFCEKLFANPTSWQDSRQSAELLCKMASLLPLLCAEVSPAAATPLPSTSSASAGESFKKPQTHKDFALFASDCHRKMVAVAKSRGGGGCVLL